MEKASKKVSEVEIELTDRKVTLATITQADLSSLILDKENGFPLKRGLVSDDGETYVERRLFKRTNNAKVVLFDLPIPISEKAFNALSFATRHENFVKGYRVARDAEEIGGSGGPKLTSEEKDFARKMASVDDATRKKVEDILRKSGFLK